LPEPHREGTFLRYRSPSMPTSQAGGQKATLGAHILRTPSIPPPCPPHTATLGDGWLGREFSILRRAPMQDGFFGRAEAQWCSQPLLCFSSARCFWQSSGSGECGSDYASDHCNGNGGGRASGGGGGVGRGMAEDVAVTGMGAPRGRSHWGESLHVLHGRRVA
jgi:hypothetical protein